MVASDTQILIGNYASLAWSFVLTPHFRLALVLNQPVVCYSLEWKSEGDVGELVAEPLFDYQCCLSSLDLTTGNPRIQTHIFTKWSSESRPKMSERCDTGSIFERPGPARWVALTVSWNSARARETGSESLDISEMLSFCCEFLIPMLVLATRFRASRLAFRTAIQCFYLGWRKNTQIFNNKKMKPTGQGLQNKSESELRRAVPSLECLLS